MERIVIALDGINWMACWVSLAIGVGLGMFIAAVLAKSRE